MFVNIRDVFTIEFKNEALVNFFCEKKLNPNVSFTDYCMKLIEDDLYDREVNNTPECKEAIETFLKNMFFTSLAEWIEYNIRQEIEKSLEICKNCNVCESANGLCYHIGELVSPYMSSKGCTYYTPLRPYLRVVQ